MKRFSNNFFLLVILIIGIFMVTNPQETVWAAAAGINLWATVVLPALIPFFIVADLFVNLGLVNFLEVVLEPLMRPLFRLPGSSSLVIVMGFTSGFPVGAVVTRKLLEDRLLNNEEAERLLCFTNNSSPLFIMGAIGIGILANPLAGYILAVSHYLSNLIIGILLRFKAPRKAAQYASGKKNRLREAIEALYTAQQKNQSGIGKLMGDAIRNSINNIMAIGGFIVVFSVVSHMLSVWGILSQLALWLQKITFFNINFPLALGICKGIFEVTLGAKAVALSNEPLIIQLISISILMAFCGLSIIAQIMSIMAGIKVNWRFFMLARFIQILLSTAITVIAYYLTLILQVPAFIANQYANKILYSYDSWNFSIFLLLLALLILIIMSVIVLYRDKN